MPEGPPRSRFDAVLVDPNAKVTPPEEFCEKFATAEDGEAVPGAGARR